MVVLETQWVRLEYDEVKGTFDVFDKIIESKVITHTFCSFTLSSSDTEELILSSFDDCQKDCEIQPISDNNGNGKILVATFTYETGFITTLKITVYDNNPFLLFQSSIKSSQQGYKLKSLKPLALSKSHQGDLQMGSIEDWRLFRQDWQSWSPVEVTPLNKRIKRPWMKVPNRIDYSTKEN